MNFIWGLVGVVAGSSAPADAEETGEMLESPSSWRSAPTIRLRADPYKIEPSTSSSATPKQKRMPAKLLNGTQISHIAPKSEEGAAESLVVKNEASAPVNGSTIEASTSGSSATPKEKRLPAKVGNPIQPRPVALKLEGEDAEIVVKSETSTPAITQTTSSTPDPSGEEYDKALPFHLFPSFTASSSDKIQYPNLSKLSNGFGSTLEECTVVKFTKATMVHLDCLQSLPLKSHQIEGFEFLRGLESAGLTGGILADDMGLGKTLQIIALILADGQSGVAQGCSSMTLVVVPPSLVFQWVAEIQKFAPILKVHVHHGKTKIVDADDPRLEGIDVVITTYDLVRLEHEAYETVNVANKSLSNTPLFTITWRRVVLDEAQYIRNREGKRSLACRALPKVFGHCVTGTPAQNKIDDLYPLFDFLRIHGLCDWNNFLALISVPANNGRWYIAYAHLKRTLGIWLLRRTKLTKHDGKEIVKLKNRYDEYVRCEITGKQKDGCHFIEAHYPGMEWTKYILHRLLCDHPIFLRKFVDKFNDGNLDKGSKKAVKEWLDTSMGVEDGLDSDEMFKFPALCDQCNANERSHTLETSPVLVEPSNLSIRASPKFTKAIDIITSVLENNCLKDCSGDPDKILVVSSFVKTLDLFEKALDVYGIKSTKLNGQMSPSQRGQALEKIKNDPEVVVFLLSFNAGGVGLNITSCNHLILFEPWWNPYAEDQVFGRVYRMGQKNDVFVYKMYAGNTIEEKILEVQEKKRKLIRGAFLGSCDPDIDSNEPTDEDLRLLSKELETIRASSF